MLSKVMRRLNSHLGIVIDMAKKLRRTLPKRLNGTLRQLNKDIHQHKTTLVYAITTGKES